MTTDPVGTALSLILFTIAAGVLLTILFYDRVKEWAVHWRERPRARVRWYNRLAAWLYETATDWLVPLAEPVWMARAEEDLEEQEREERFAAMHQSEIDAIAEEAWDEGYEEAAREDDRHRRPY